MFRLYYLVDQTASGSAGIYDQKTLEDVFSSLSLAQAQATTDGVAHYSVETYIDADGIDSEIVFIQ